jgi:hypothetical protein
MWIWQVVQRQNYVNKAAAIYLRFKLSPYVKEVRDEIRIITNNRLCPTKHKIHNVRKLIDKQDICIQIIKKKLKSFKLRNSIISRMLVKIMLRKQESTKANKIQRFFKHVKSKRELTTKILMKENEAATIITSFFHKYFKSLKSIVYSISADRKKAGLHAIDTFKYVLSYHVCKYLVRKNTQKQKEIAEEKLRYERYLYYMLYMHYSLLLFIVFIIFILLHINIYTPC